MARVPYLNEEDLNPEDRYLLARPINLFRALANHPEALRHLHGTGEWIRWNSTLDPRLRELVILAVGQAARSPYEYSHHVKIAMDFGVVPDDIEAMRAYAAGQPTSLGELDRTALDAAREMTDLGRVERETWNALTSLIGVPQTVELAFVAAYYAMVTRMLATLEVDVEPEYQGYLDRFPLG
jgi:alkylhydroperoxidase family enzyme